MSTFYILLLLLSIPFIVVLILLTQNKKWWKFIFLLIPFVLILVFKLWLAVEYIKSAPTDVIPDKFTLIYSIEAQKKYIYIWALEEGKDYPTTIVIPWSEKASKELSQAKQKDQKGIRMVRDKNQNRKNGDPIDELKFYNFNLIDEYQKNVQ